MINKLVKPTNGIDVLEDLLKIGYVAQGNELFPHLNVKDNINFKLILKRIKQMKLKN